MKKLLSLLALVFLFSCTNDPEPDEPQLLLTTSIQDSIVFPSGAPAIFGLVLSADGKAVSDADVSVSKDGATRITIGKTDATGSIQFRDSAMDASDVQWKKYSFIASKNGHKASTALLRHARFVAPILQIADTTRGSAGQELSIPLTLTFNGQPLVGGAISILDSTTGFAGTLTLDAEGRAVFQYTIPGNAPVGVRAFSAVGVVSGSPVGFRKAFYVEVEGVKHPAPASIAVTSINHSTIAAIWEPIPGYTGEYFIQAYRPDGTAAAFNTSTSPRVNVAGLSPNTLYKIGVRAKEGGAEIRSIEWATAKRMPRETDQPNVTVRVWDNYTPQNIGKSGLVIREDGIEIVDIRSADSDKIDIIVAGDPSPESPVYLLSPGVVGSGITNARSSLFPDQTFEVRGGMNEDFYAEDLTTSFTGQYNAAAVMHRSSPSNYSLIVPVILNLEGDRHYARIEVVPQPDGQLYGVSGGYYFIDVAVSYQTLTNAPYAGRPLKRKINEPKRVGKTIRK